MTADNIPESTSPRVRARVEELNAEDAAKRRIAARTGQLSPEEAAEVLGTVPRREPRDIQQSDEPVTESRDPEGAIEVEHERAQDGPPEHDADCSGCAAIAAERAETVTPENSDHEADRWGPDEHKRAEWTDGEPFTVAGTTNTGAEELADEPCDCGDEECRRIGEALRGIGFGPAFLFTSPTPPVPVPEPPTYEQRIEALAQAKTILGAMRPTGDLVYAATWLLGLGGDLDEKADDD